MAERVGETQHGPRGTWAMATLALATACILPDSNIQFDEELDNPGAVRIVRETPVTAEANAACAEVSNQSACPQPPPALTNEELLLQEGPFCVCPEEQRDANALNQFEIYAEDPDRDEDNNPTDDLFAAFLLDMPNNAVDPSQFVAYTNYLNPTEPARLNPTVYQDSIERPDPGLKAFPVLDADDNSQQVDLCNDNEGSPAQAADGTARLHNLQVIVTDRPWAPRRDPAGNVVDPDDLLIGVPDVAIGASYSTFNFVFRCADSAEDTSCNCRPRDEEEQP